MNKRSLKFQSLALVPALIFTLIWGGSMIYHEILTFQHGHTFKEIVAAEEDIQNMYGSNVGFIKVLDLSDTFAKIYHVGINRSGGISDSRIGARLGGEVFHFEKTDGDWSLILWDTVWSGAGGNADGFVWPYFHHSSVPRTFILAPLILVTVILWVTIVVVDRFGRTNRTN